MELHAQNPEESITSHPQLAKQAKDQQKGENYSTSTADSTSTCNSVSNEFSEPNKKPRDAVNVEQQQLYQELMSLIQRMQVLMGKSDTRSLLIEAYQEAFPNDPILPTLKHVRDPDSYSTADSYSSERTKSTAINSNNFDLNKKSENNVPTPSIFNKESIQNKIEDKIADTPKNNIDNILRKIADLSKDERKESSLPLNGISKSLEMDRNKKQIPFEAFPKNVPMQESAYFPLRSYPNPLYPPKQEFDISRFGSNLSSDSTRDSLTSSLYQAGFRPQTPTILQPSMNFILSNPQFDPFMMNKFHPQIYHKIPLNMLYDKSSMDLKAEASTADTTSQSTQRDQSYQSILANVQQLKKKISLLHINVIELKDEVIIVKKRIIAKEIEEFQKQQHQTIAPLMPLITISPGNLNPFSAQSTYSEPGSGEKKKQLKDHKNSLFESKDKTRISDVLRKEFQNTKRKLYLKDIAKNLYQFLKVIKLEKLIPSVTIPLKWDITDDEIFDTFEKYPNIKNLEEIKDSLSRVSQPASSTTLNFLKDVDLFELYHNQRYQDSAAKEDDLEALNAKFENCESTLIKYKTNLYHFKLNLSSVKEKILEAKIDFDKVKVEEVCG